MLEQAITNYAKAVSEHDDGDLLTGWHIITVGARVSDPDVSVLTTLSPPSLTAEAQLGLLHAALLKAERGYVED